MLYIVLPLSNKPIAACPDLSTSSFHLSAFEFAFIDGLVGPCHLAFALHIIVLKRALVESAGVSEVVLSEAMELTIDEIALVIASFELEPALTSLLALYKVAGKLDFVVVPGLSAEAMLLIILPLSLVH